MAFRNSAAQILPGFGTAGNDGGSSVYVTGTASGVATTVPTATAVSLGTCNAGYVHVRLSGGASSAIIDSITVEIDDGTTHQYIYGAAFVSLVANQGMTLLIPFMSDLAINRATVVFITSIGTFNVDIELVGNTCIPPTGTGTL